MSAPLAVPELAAVEAALGRLWQATAARSDHAVIRAITFNLVAAVADDGEAQATAAILTDVVARRPGRVLIASLDPTGADRLEAWVATQCRLVGDGTQVCGEQVLIAASGPGVDRLAATAPVLFVPDCPAFLWWRLGPGPATPFLHRLLPSLDAVLLDGARFDTTTLRAWAARLGAGREGVTLGDLAWLRARPWRGWLADCFEPAAARAALRNVTLARVEHGPGAEMVARLFAAWLTARLSLPGHRVEVRAGPGPAASGLLAVRLEAGGLRCELRRDDAAAVAVTVAHDGAVTRRVIRHAAPSDGALVAEWVASPQWDPGYGEALGCLAAVAT